MNTHPDLPPLGPALAVAFFLAFAAYFGFCLWRRDRSTHPGSKPLFSITCGVKAGLSFVSPPFVRLEIWPSELVFKNFNLTVSRSDLTGLTLSQVLGGTILLIHHRRAEVSPVEVCGIDAARLHASITHLYPETVQSSSPGAPAPPPPA
jgi:hypothetical protein